jgi:hypothetical protein
MKKCSTAENHCWFCQLTFIGHPISILKTGEQASNAASPNNDIGTVIAMLRSAISIVRSISGSLTIVVRQSVFHREFRWGRIKRGPSVRSSGLPDLLVNLSPVCYLPPRQTRRLRCFVSLLPPVSSAVPSWSRTLFHSFASTVAAFDDAPLRMRCLFFRYRSSFI